MKGEMIAGNQSRIGVFFGVTTAFRWQKEELCNTPMAMAKRDSISLDVREYRYVLWYIELLRALSFNAMPKDDPVHQG
jgi:hypothetical protein